MTFLTDRAPEQERFYKEDFCKLFESELTEFLKETSLTEISVLDVWTVEYHYGDYQVPHTHRSVGISGILYVNFNPKEHSGTQAMQPWNDPITDQAVFMDFMPEEGTMILFPSFLIHFINPNFSRNRRTIMAFDLEVKE